MTFSFEAELWEYQGEAPWVFATLPVDLADEIESTISERTPFGSIRVAVSVGETRWETSLFPDRDQETYVLPVKKQVRHSAALDIGDSATFELTLMD